MITLNNQQSIAVDSVANAIRAGHKEIMLRLPIGFGASIISVALAHRLNAVLAFKHPTMGDQLRHIAQGMQANAWAVTLDHHNTFEPLPIAAPIAILGDDVKAFNPPPGYTIVRIATGYASPSIQIAPPAAQPLNFAQRMRVYNRVMQPMIDARMLSVEWRVPVGRSQAEGKHFYRAAEAKR